MQLTNYHSKYFAYELTKRCASDDENKLAAAVAGAQVDLNPHQVEAALFAFRSPLSKGALIADEVGLGKTIEAGLVIAQKWAERKRRILVITPANLHPGEGLNKISLELDPKKRASLEIGASFCGQSKTPPQAYFSDSHLDTLGLCVFLALAALDAPAATILVLDDVLASVDEPHVERLIEMLYDEAARFQHCVFTTHYRPWKQKLRWGWLQNGQCHFVELTKWTASDGLTLIRSVPDVERLRQLLAEAPPDPQLVCAKAGHS